MSYDDTAIDRHFARLNEAPKPTKGPGPAPQEPDPVVPAVGQQGTLDGGGDPLGANKYAGPNGDGRTPLNEVIGNPFAGRKAT
jgi:hypothetical protein